MKRPGYREHVRWIAANDDWDARTPDEMAALPTAVMTAELFDVEYERVGRDIARERKRLERERRRAQRGEPRA
jgi:hypothetical protein